MIYESDKIRKQKETMEYQLEKIGVNIDRIKKATEELKEDRGYVHTGDREKYDEEQDRKRKADETLREQEEKKQKTITVGEGEEVILIEEDREQKLARQQQEIIRQQEILLQNQEQHILNQETRIRRMEEQKLQPQQPFSQTMSTSSRFKKPIATGGAGTIDKFLSAKGIRFMPKCLVKQEPTEEEEDEDVITEVTKKTETVKYLPKAVPGIENLILVQVPKSKTTAKRSSKAGPVPENLQDPKRFYCDKYEAHSKRPDELTRHKKKNCLKEDPEYFCEECGKGFFYENTVREHYYHIHTDIMLWHCTRCSEGFHFKSNKSKHRNACRNKNGPEIYQPRAPFNEKLEETFKPKTAIPVSIPPQAQPDPQPKPEDKPEDQPEDQPED